MLPKHYSLGVCIQVREAENRGTIWFRKWSYAENQSSERPYAGNEQRASPVRSCCSRERQEPGKEMLQQRVTGRDCADIWGWGQSRQEQRIWGVSRCALETPSSSLHPPNVTCTVGGNMYTVSSLFPLSIWESEVHSGFRWSSPKPHNGKASF